MSSVCFGNLKNLLINLKNDWLIEIYIFSIRGYAWIELSTHSFGKKLQIWLNQCSLGKQVISFDEILVRIQKHRHFMTQADDEGLIVI